MKTLFQTQKLNLFKYSFVVFQQAAPAPAPALSAAEIEQKAKEELKKEKDKGEKEIKAGVVELTKNATEKLKTVNPKFKPDAELKDLLADVGQELKQYTDENVEEPAKYNKERVNEIKAVRAKNIFELYANYVKNVKARQELNDKVDKRLQDVVKANKDKYDALPPDLKAKLSFAQLPAMLSGKVADYIAKQEGPKARYILEELNVGTGALADYLKDLQTNLFTKVAGILAGSGDKAAELLKLLDDTVDEMVSKALKARQEALITENDRLQKEFIAADGKFSDVDDNDGQQLYVVALSIFPLYTIDMFGKGASWKENTNVTIDYLPLIEKENQLYEKYKKEREIFKTDKVNSNNVLGELKTKFDNLSLIQPEQKKALIELYKQYGQELKLEDAADYDKLIAGHTEEDIVNSNLIVMNKIQQGEIKLISAWLNLQQAVPVAPAAPGATPGVTPPPAPAAGPAAAPDLLKSKENVEKELNDKLAAIEKTVQDELAASNNPYYKAVMDGFQKNVVRIRKDIKDGVAGAADQAALDALKKVQLPKIDKLADDVKKAVEQKEKLNKAIADNQKLKQDLEKLGVRPDYLASKMAADPAFKKLYEDTQALFKACDPKLFKPADITKPDFHFNSRGLNDTPYDVEGKVTTALEGENKLLTALKTLKEADEKKAKEIVAIKDVNVKKVGDNLIITIQGLDKDNKEIKPPMEISVDFMKYYPRISHLMKYDTDTPINIEALNADPLALGKILPANILQIIQTKHLDKVKGILDIINKAKPVLMVQGCASPDGYESRNIQLCQIRAKKVADKIIEKYPFLKDKVKISPKPRILGAYGKDVTGKSKTEIWKDFVKQYNEENSKKIAQPQFLSMLDKYNAGQPLTPPEAQAFFDKTFGASRNAEVMFKAQADFDKTIAMGPAAAPAAGVPPTAVAGLTSGAAGGAPGTPPAGGATPPPPRATR